MPVATYSDYCNMLDNAYEKHYAYPAINVYNMESVCGVLEGLSAAKSDGIIQLSIGGAIHASGQKIKDAVSGAIALAEYIHRVAEKYPIFVAIHTDHCKYDNIDDFLIPLIDETEKRRLNGQPNLFTSHMFDGSTLPHKENIQVSKKLLKKCAKNDLILEVEAGVVGSATDISADKINQKLYTTPEDMIMMDDELYNIGRYTLAATFGNVHGVYKPGNVKLNPKILKAGQEVLKKIKGESRHYDLVFHGGSGSTQSEIQETLLYGVTKMNIDTDTQYAFTRNVADYMYKNYDGVLKIDGEVGIKKIYDPRSYLKLGEEGICQRVIKACSDLNSTGHSLIK